MVVIFVPSSLPFISERILKLSKCMIQECKTTHCTRGLNVAPYMSNGHYETSSMILVLIGPLTFYEEP